MTKIIAFLFVLLGMIQAVAQEYEYVPFVREGVKWVYCYNNPFMEYVLDMPERVQYYSFEMLGDVQIGDKFYKPVLLTHYFDKDGANKEVEDFIPVYLREENKMVYAIHPDGIEHPQCPVGFCRSIHDPYVPSTSSEEFVLYDFNDPVPLYGTTLAAWGIEYVQTDTIAVGPYHSKCHYFQLLNYPGYENIIEGIGYDGVVGMPLFYFLAPITEAQVAYGLSHVLEDGEIIYKGRWYDGDIHVGIDEEVNEQPRRMCDGNYYNLVGQPVGKDVPTTPGIYVHDGKKIVVR